MPISNVLNRIFALKVKIGGFLIALVILCSLRSSYTYAQGAFVEKGIGIVLSTKDYKSALQLAREASEKLGIEINLRGYYPDENGGLKTDLSCGCGIVHDYIARGRLDDGVYISIEYSNYYKGFAKGYYIVVVASGARDDERLKEAVANAQRHYPDAYIKNASVYIGCMH